MLNIFVWIINFFVNDKNSRTQVTVIQGDVEVLQIGRSTFVYSRLEMSYHRFSFLVASLLQLMMVASGLVAIVSSNSPVTTIFLWLATGFMYLFCTAALAIDLKRIVTIYWIVINIIFILII